MAEEDWTEDNRFASRSGAWRNGFDFESFMPSILRHHAPIEWDREAGGYRFVKPDSAAPVYKLPGLWFSPRERMSSPRRRGSSLLESLEPTLLGAHLAPLKSRLEALLSTGERSALVPMGARKHEPKHFELIASAVLNRQRLRLTYWNRTKDVVTERVVSPQRLIHYRENWYLDAWCHLRNDLRSFALDAMRGVEMVAGKVKEVPDKELDEVLASGYGIFSGKKVQWVTLRFTPERARYVAMEEWHPKQRMKYEKNGSYILEVPFSSENELLMDVLRFGADVEVIAPASLRTAVRARAEAIVSTYQVRFAALRGRARKALRTDALTEVLRGYGEDAKDPGFRKRS